MHNRNVKRWTTTVIALVMTATLLGCSTTAGPTAAPAATTPAPATSATQAPAPTADDLDDPYGRYEETVSVSVYSIDTKSASEYDSSNPDRKSAAENMWISGYLEYLNIDLERVIAEDWTALNATINTSMATGDLYDIMFVGKDMFFVMAENDVLADLSEPYGAYAGSKGRLLSEAVATSPGALLAGTVDGQMLGFPLIGNSYNNSEVLWVRQDWLDQVDMELPSTIDDMIDVARAFKEAECGGENTLGLGLVDISASFMAAYGVVMGTWQQDDTGSYVYANTMDEMKDGLLKLREIYAEGLVKSDFAVTNILAEETANGLVGLRYGPGWLGATDIKSSNLNDENADWTCGPIPTLDGGEVRQLTNNNIGYFFVVNKNCAHPEALFKMIEMELHMYYEPTPEESLIYYICEDQYTAWDLRVFRNFGRADQDFLRTRMINEGVASGAEDVAAIASASFKRVLLGLAGDRNEAGYATVFQVGYPIIMDKLEKGLLVGSYNGPVTENMTLYLSTINEALNSECLKVVMGADISVFDAAVEAWYANGGQDITDEVNEYYEGLE